MQSPGRRLADDGLGVALDDAKHSPGLQTGTESLSQSLPRLVLDVDNDGEPIGGPVREWCALLRPQPARCGGDQVAMRISAGMSQMIRQGIEFVRYKVVLCTLGCVMQPIERQLALVGEIALPKSVSSQDMESQSFSRLGQLQHTRAGAHVSRRFQVLSETQGRGR